MKFLTVGSRIDHLERWQAAQQRLIVFEVGNEAEKAIAGRVAVDEGGDRGIRSRFRTAEKDRKPVYEIPLSLGLGLRALVGSVRQEGKRKVKGLVEVADFFLLGFEVRVIRMGQNKVQNEEPGADQFVGETTAVAEIVLLDGLVEGACK
jgi:hypothetical protein